MSFKEYINEKQLDQKDILNSLKAALKDLDKDSKTAKSIQKTIKNIEDMNKGK